jgi:hypothetical protein
VTYRECRATATLLDEIDAAAPHRSKVSDGWIGDAAHASRDSDHNPWVILAGVGIVRARDFTHDPIHGLDCNQLARALAALIAAGAHPACRHGAYVIWNRRIFSFDRRAEGWRTYTGSNAHEHHCHLSVSLDPAGFDSTAPWGVMEVDDMFDADAKALLENVDAKITALAAAVQADETSDRVEAKRARARMERVMKRLAAIRDQAKDDATRTDLKQLLDELTAGEG